MNVLHDPSETKYKMRQILGARISGIKLTCHGATPEARRRSQEQKAASLSGTLPEAGVLPEQLGLGEHVSVLDILSRVEDRQEWDEVVPRLAESLMDSR